MVPQGDRGSRLRGRRRECDALDELVASVRAGESRVLVLWGEPGVGKTALLDYAAESASRCRVTRVCGDAAEKELAFSSLHLLCAPMLHRLDLIPRPQQNALATAFGLRTGDPPDRFLVGLAVLSLLAEVAEEQPLVWLVDDMQWLDQATALTLAFVARRLLAERIGMVFAARDGADGRGLEGLPGLSIHGLGDADARALLGESLHAPLDPAVMDQIVAETHGNPLALLELPRAMTPTELAGGFALSGTMSLPGRIEAGFIRRIALLPPPTQCLLLVASAESVGDPIVVWRAASSLGIAGDAATPATEAGLVEFGGRVVFRHPLVRSAAYRRATAAERHDAHRALAEATDANVDPDRRAWHRAQATPAPDEDVAVELERAASRARGRGGLAAAAAFLDRSVALTTDPARRGERALAAAEAKHQAGAHEAALALVARAETGPLDKVQRARIEMLRGQIAFGSSHGGDAPSLLLAAARQLDSLDAALARDTYLDALTAALFVGRLRGAVGVLEVAESARAAPASLARPPDLLLDGFAVVITEGFATGAPLLKRAVEAFRTEDIPAPQAVRWLWHATHAAHDLWDDESWDLLCTRHIQLARQVGALGILPIALSARIGLHLFAGELTLAASLVEELAAVTEATGSGLPPYGALALAAWQGREAKASELIRAVRSELVPRGEGMGLTLVDHAAAVLYNGLGRYEEACEAARRGAEHPHELAFSAWSLVQLVEAAARSDQLALARDALERLAEMTGPSGTSWALGIEARSRALVSDREEAEGLYREAIDHLGRTRLPLELARAHLLYGEWLRRENRRVDARQQLRTAHESFLAMGTEAFGERARRELAATGETVRKRTVNTSLQLTAQEAQIARLAAEGRTNPEIGAELFISARTVEWHLRKVYPKLGITSRRELRRALPDGRLSGAPA